MTTLRMFAPIGPSMPRGHEPPHDRLVWNTTQPLGTPAGATQSSFECAASEKEAGGVAALRLNQLSPSWSTADPRPPRDQRARKIAIADTELRSIQAVLARSQCAEQKWRS